MGLVPKWLRDWISSLMPRQENKGSGTVQMGNVQGTVQNVTHVTHQHFYGSPGTAPVHRPPEPDAIAISEAKAKDAQREVLALMQRLDRPIRIKVLEFMRREFNTAMVIELKPEQVYRVRRYVETVRKNERERA